MNSQKNQPHPSSSISSRPIDNIYKSNTYRPQTNYLGTDFQNYNTMKHKKVLSHDAQGYKQRVRNAIKEIFRKQIHQGILVEKLKQMLSSILGFQIQNELLGVDKFTDFILQDMQNVCTMKVIANPHCPNGDYMYIVTPINEFNPGHMLNQMHWRNQSIYYPNFTPNQMNINTPTTCDRSRMTTSNLDNMLEKNHSLNHNSRKGYYFSPNMDNSFQKMAQKGEKQSLGMGSYLSEISKNDQHDNFSMTSYKINKEFTLEKNFEEQNINSYKKFDEYENKDSEKEKTGFNFCVYNNDSLQVGSGDEDDIKCKSSKSSDDENPSKDILVRKKQIRLSKSSYKKRSPHLFKEANKLIEILDI